MADNTTTYQLQDSPIYVNMVALRSALLNPVLIHSDWIVPNEVPDLTVSLKFDSIEARDAFVAAFLELRGVK